MLTILLFLITSKGFANPQSPNLLIYEGDTTEMYTLLLKQYFDQIKKNDDVKRKFFESGFREGVSFNCWGAYAYRAIFRVENDSLWLEQIISCKEHFSSDLIDTKKSKKRISEIFGNKVVGGKVFVDWFSGNLSISKPESKILRSEWDSVFTYTFEEEIMIEFDEGVVKNITEIKNYIDEPSGINRKYRDKISKVIFREILKIKWNNIDKFDCSEVYRIKIGKDGRIEEVIMPACQTEEQISKQWETKREYNYCLETLTRGLSKLKFDIVKKSGQAIEENIDIKIWINNDGTIENWPD